MVERIRTLLETRQLTPTQFADAIGIARPIVSHILSGRNKPSLEVVQRILAAMPDLSMPWLLNGTGPMLAAGVAAPAAPLVAPAPQAAPARPVTPPPAASDTAVGAPDAPASAPKSPRTPINRAPRGSNVSVSHAQAASFGAAHKPEPKRFATTKPMNAAGLGNGAPRVAIATAVAEAPAALASPPVLPMAPQSAISSAPSAPVIPEAPVASSVPTPTTAALLARTEKPIRRIVIFYHDGSFADYQPE